MRTGDLPETTANVAAATLTGDIRDIMLGQAKRNSKTWDKRSEREQQTFIDACTAAAEDVARKAIKAVSSRGFDAIEFTWGSIQIKDGGITAQVKCDGSVENVLAMLSGGRAVIVLTRPAEFFGERAAAKPDPDQPDLMDKAAASAGAPVDVNGEDDVGEQLPSNAGQGAEPEDALAAGQQRAALAGEDEAWENGDQPATSLGDAVQQNVDRLAGIQQLRADEVEPLGDGTSGAKKRRGRRSMEQRQADEEAARAAHQAGQKQTEQRAE